MLSAVADGAGTGVGAGAGAGALLAVVPPDPPLLAPANTRTT